MYTHFIPASELMVVMHCSSSRSTYIISSNSSSRWYVIECIVHLPVSTALNMSD